MVTDKKKTAITNKYTLVIKDLQNYIMNRRLRGIAETDFNMAYYAVILSSPLKITPFSISNIKGKLVYFL